MLKQQKDFEETNLFNNGKKQHQIISEYYIKTLVNNFYIKFYITKQKSITGQFFN